MPTCPNCGAEIPDFEPSDEPQTWVDLDWSLDEGAPRMGTQYHVLRGTDPRVLITLGSLEPFTATSLRDAAPRALAVPLVHYYRVLAADDCEQLSDG